MSTLSKRKGIRHVAAMMTFVMILFGMLPKLDASFIPSVDSDLRGKDMKIIQKALETKQVRSRLEALGFTAEEINARLDQLSNEEVHKLAERIDALTTAGDGLGLLVGVLVVFLLVIVILKLMNRDIIIR